MPKSHEIVMLELKPIPPDTISSIRQEILPLIEATLREADKESLLADGQIQVRVEKTFPVDASIIVALTFLSAIAVETYKELILPKLRRQFEVRQRRRRQEKKNKPATKKRSSTREHATRKSRRK